jgi:hypothetical protein
MSKLTNLQAKAKEYSIGGEQFQFKPLTLRNLDLFIDLTGQDVPKRVDAMDKLIRLTLKENDSSITDEELDNLSLENLNEIMDAIFEVNGVKLDEKKAKLLEQMNAGQRK